MRGAAMRAAQILAYVRVGSKPELPFSGLMSASASSGHVPPLAMVRVVPILSKIPGVKFFERNEAHYDSLINMAPRPLAKPPVSLSRGDEVPHIFIRESHQRARKILISSGKRLLQQNLPEAAIPWVCP